MLVPPDLADRDEVGYVDCLFTHLLILPRSDEDRRESPDDGQIDSTLTDGAPGITVAD